MNVSSAAVDAAATRIVGIMATVAAYGKTQAPSAVRSHFEWGLLRVGILSVHLVIVAYVGIGWLGSSRATLLFYLLLLPTIAIQWLLNAGTSILNNVESLVYTRHWHDERNSLEGHFFQSLLRVVGITASNALINVVVCTIMLFFWIEAFYRMILIPTAP